MLGAVAVLTLHSGHGTPRSRTDSVHRYRAVPAGQQPRPPSVLTTGHPLLGVTGGWQLFARGPADLVSVQLARGRITVTSVPELETGNPIVSFLIGPHEAIVRSADLVPGYVIPDGGAARQLTGPLAGSGPLVPGPDPGHAWVMSRTPVRPTLSLIDLNGKPTGTLIRIPQGGDQLPATAMPDGGGYVLMQGSANDLYDAGPTWDRLVNATILATGPTRWLAVGCNAYYRHCVDEVIDPATGARRLLPGPLVSGLYGLFEQDVPPRGVVSPDGLTAAVPVADNYGTITVHLINLTTGANHAVAVRMSASPGNQCVVWSPDGNWLFVAANGGRLLAVNAHSRHVQSLGVTLPYVTQVAIRDAPG